ncbi:MAG: hypothetical protein CMJ78_03410 [Planctomycetaceae bacterium]|nr:hypothetical protein [Planctomycetaceae bacterium]
MRQNDWLNNVRIRLRSLTKKSSRRRITRPALQSIEKFEDRTLLTVSALFFGGNLIISSDAGGSITLQDDPTIPGNVQVLTNGAPDNILPTFDGSLVSVLQINGGDGTNSINIAGLTTATLDTVGVTIQIDGGDADDFIQGSAAFAEVLLGGDGDDTITGLNGLDTIDGGDGDDSLTGGTDADNITGGDGADTIDSGDGDDVIDGGNSEDSITSGDGADTVSGGSGADTIDTGLGDDIVMAGSGDDIVFVGDGADSVVAGPGNDLLNGSTGNDTLNGQSGNDTVNGDDGDDSLIGAQGNDSINGAAGNDRLTGNNGNDTIEGAEGNDQIFGGSGNDLLSGADGDDTIRGHRGNDQLFGGQGADFLDGGTGNDLLDTQTAISISIDDIRFEMEGDLGDTTTQNFTVTLSEPSAATIQVEFATADGTATSMGPTPDYQATMDTLVFDPGVTSLTIPVTIIGDVEIESSEENFLVNLSNPVNATIFDGQGDARIVDDDGAGPGGIQITPTNNVGALINALVGGGGAGLTVTGMTLQEQNNGVDFSTGTYVVGTTQTYGLDRGGIVISSGDVADYETGPDTINEQTTDYGATATAAQQALIDPINGMQPAFDVTQLDITFDMMPGFDTVFFEVVFGSEEFPDFVLQGLNDAFGLIVNGTNIANVAGAPVNIDHPGFAAVAGTELNGVLVDNGSPRLLFQQVVGDGSTGNTLTIILGDSGASAFDTTAYISSLGATTPPPPPPPPPAPPAPPTPGSQDDTLRGSSGNDTILSGIGEDILAGGSGNDSIRGGASDDKLFGGSGADTLEGEMGDDTLDGQRDDDVLIGDAGQDTFIWDGASDGTDDYQGITGADRVEVRGGSGTDSFTVKQSIPQAGALLQISDGSATITINADIPEVFVTGGAGADTLTVTNLNKVTPIQLTVDGGPGDDAITAAGADLGFTFLSLQGGSGNDTITGSDFTDTISGGTGNDNLNGNGGNDVINGDAGDDVLSGGGGNDIITGGDDDDVLNGNNGDDVLNGGTGDDSIRGDDGNDTALGEEGEDTLIGNDGDDSLEGGEDEDRLFGGNGNDALRGGAADDILRGQAGDDNIRGGDGDDLLFGDDGNDILNGDDGDDMIDAGNGNNGVTGGDGNDRLIAGNGNDTMRGGDGNDTLLGAAGLDILLGGDGDDSVNGQGGSDTIAGGDGDDTVVGAASEIDESFQLSAAVIATLDA